MPSDDRELLRRLLESRYCFRRRDERGTVWSATCEGHLVVVALCEDDEERHTLVVDGEPLGELTGWPPLWERD